MPFGTGPGGEGPTGEVRDQVQIEPGLEATLLAPEQVVAGDSFRVRFTAENKTTGTLRLQTGGCWGRPAAFLGEERVPLVGSLQVCTMELLTWELSGKESRTQEFDMKASVNVSSGSPKEEGPTEPGAYTLRTTVDWTVEGQKVEKTLEVPLSVARQR